MTNATSPQYLGILPMVGYNFAPPSPSNYLDIYPGWSQVWKPAYGLFKFRRVVGRSNVTDWGFVELRGIIAPLYDFCGGMLTSSPNVVVNEPSIETFDTRNAWGTIDDVRWRTVDHSVGRSPDRYHNRLGNEKDREKLMALIPSVDPYLGPGPFTSNQMRLIGRKSLAAWLASMATGYGRRGIFGADRTSYATELRNTLKDIKTLDFYWTHLPNMHVLDRQHRSGSVRPGSPGHKESVLSARGSKFSGGTRYRNPNSGRAVAMCGAILPDSSRNSVQASADFRVMAANIPPDEWAKLIDPEYISLFPADPPHNG